MFGDLAITLEHVSPEQALQTLLVSRTDATLLDISPFPEVPLELIASIVAVAPMRQFWRWWSTMLIHVLRRRWLPVRTM